MIVEKSRSGILLAKITRIDMRVAIFVVLSLLRLRHTTLRHDAKNLSIEAKQRHVKELIVTHEVIKRRLLHHNILVDDGSILKLMANILGRRPSDSAMILKSDETNKRNEDAFDRVENNRRRLIRFPIIPNIHIGKPA
jgi:hypothetical protein